MHPNVCSNIIYNCQDMKEPKSPSRDKWIKKMCVYIYTHVSLIPESGRSPGGGNGNPL